MGLYLSDSFARSLVDLDPADARRVAAFVGKLIAAPQAASLRPEIVHDAADRKIRSFKVTHDLRAIAHIDGADALLLFAARHDRAYAWARDRCIECHPVTGERRLVIRGGDPQGEPVGESLCAGTGELCAVLDRYGIAHGLAE